MENWKNLNLENLKNEIWKDVINYEGYYLVSNLGRIKRYGKKKCLKQHISRQGYLRVTLQASNKHITTHIHRLIGIAFLENNLGSNEVHHISGNKLDNRLENLCWVTRKVNQEKRLYKSKLKRESLESFKNFVLTLQERYNIESIKELIQLLNSKELESLYRKYIRKNYENIHSSDM